MRQLMLILGLGCLLGCGLWLTVGRLGRPTAPDEALAAAAPAVPQVSIADALSMPVFTAQQDLGVPVAQPAPAAAPANVRLLGISFTPRRRAAFISAGGQPFWLAVGESRDGVTLTALRRSAADFQIGGAVVQLELFKRPGAPAPQATPAPGVPAPRGNEPASAPASAPPAKVDPPGARPGGG